MNVQNQCITTSPPLPDFSVQSGFIPITDSENNEPIPPSEAVVEHLVQLNPIHYQKDIIEDHLPVMLNDCLTAHFCFCKF